MAFAAKNRGVDGAGAGRRPESVLRQFDKTLFQTCRAVAEGRIGSFLVGNPTTGPLLTVGERRAKTYVKRFERAALAEGPLA